MEYWDIYDRNGYPTGRKAVKGQQFSENDYHLAVEAWIINSKFEILLQQRSEKCPVLPNVWCHTTGRIIAGEDSLQGCIREVREELGVEISGDEIQFFQRIIRKDGTNLIWDLFLVRKDIQPSEFILQESEVSRVKWVSEETFVQMVKKQEMFQYPEIFSVLDKIKRHF